ncbi:MAG: chemotaxis-specific protein-glutamate methyltransferase CheB [bacterium]|nr:chemotaxis-specific protein-glutamate methyltransferase CheB [bacterium]
MDTIKVLVVDDSPVAREVLWEILGKDPELEVIGSVGSGDQALRFIESQELKPDVITMDVLMPGIDGFDTTRKIMETHPAPIVMITSSYGAEDVDKTFKALEAGAVTILSKPGSVLNESFEREGESIRDTLKVMAGVSVVRRWSRAKMPPVETISRGAADFKKGGGGDFRLLALGASTGGPMAIKEILSGLPRPFPVPIAIVQHIGGEFVEGMMRWLESTTGFPVVMARNGGQMEPDCVYIAPDGIHMGVAGTNAIELSQTPPEGGMCPSINYFFRSVANAYGNRAVGILLTGMGGDGALGLRELYNSGAVTFAQDEESSVIYGMPAEAIKLGAARYILPPGDIANRIGVLLKMVEEDV